MRKGINDSKIEKSCDFMFTYNVTITILQEYKVDRVPRVRGNVEKDFGLFKLDVEREGSFRLILFVALVRD